MKALFLSAILVVGAMAPQSYSGTLEASDPMWEGERHYDEYPLTAEPMQQVTVRMTSEEFDTYLIVNSAEGASYTNDDFEGSQRVSQVDFLAREGGAWTILAAGYSSESFGTYELEVTLGPVAEVETVSGRLDPSDSQSPKGEYYDTHTVRIEDDEPFTLELTCYGFDGFLVAQSPQGETSRNDDAQDMNHSRIGPLTGAGEWTVYVTTSRPEAVGAYDLEVIR